MSGNSRQRRTKRRAMASCEIGSMFSADAIKRREQLAQMQRDVIDAMRIPAAVVARAFAAQERVNERIGRLIRTVAQVRIKDE